MQQETTLRTAALAAVQPAGWAVLSWLPDAPIPAALLVILLYAGKSLTVVFPLVPLYLLSGALFPLPAAVIVNLTGVAVCATVPYLIGLRLGPGRLEKLRRRYPKLRRLEALRKKSGMQFAALTRAVGLLPGDIVSLYFGCAGLEYPAYLTGSVLGLAPGVIAATILGGQIEDFGSPGFWLSAGGSAAVALISFCACRRAMRNGAGGEKAPP